MSKKNEMSRHELLWRISATTEEMTEDKLHKVLNYVDNIDEEAEYNFNRVLNEPYWPVTFSLLR